MSEFEQQLFFDRKKDYHFKLNLGKPKWKHEYCHFHELGGNVRAPDKKYHQPKSTSMALEQEDEVPKLTGDEKRRAAATIRGFAYQIWRGVEAWLQLKAGEMLYIEGAEDIDKVSADKAQAIQIKDTKASGSLTLNSIYAVSAINHCWLIIQQNPNRRVLYQYVTTARAGIEAIKIGDEGGIKLWQFSAKIPHDKCEDEIETIKNHLLQSDKIDESLKSYLKTHANKQIHQELVSHLEWLCDEPDLAEIQERIIEDLLLNRSSLALPVREAKRLAHQLFQDVQEIAIKQTPQPLSVIDLHHRFDEFSQVQIPRTFLRANAEISPNVLAVLSALEIPGTIPTLVSELLVDYKPPTLPANTWPRPNLQASIAERSEHMVLNIIGSAGMGKTTSVLAHISDPTTVLWVPCRDMDSPALIKTCFMLRNLLQNDSRFQLIVLDDFNPSDDTRLLEVGLSRLIEAIIQNGVRAILTTYTPIGFRLGRILTLTPDTQLTIIHFTLEEIEQFLLNQGCGAAHAKRLGMLVLMQTSGHPTLVAARVASLKLTDFTTPTAEQVLEKPREILDIQEEAAETISKTLDESSRQLLYTMTIMTTPARRAILQKIAEGVTESSLPGETIGRISPAWLEEIQTGFLQVSPIILGLGGKVFSPEVLAERHRLIAEILAQESTLSPLEFAGSLFHAFMGGADQAAVKAIMAFIYAPQEIQEVLSKYISWILALSDDASIPFASQFTNQLFRILQWQVTSIERPDELERLAPIIENEIPKAAQDDPGTALVRVLWISIKLIRSEYQGEVQETLDDILELQDLITMLSKLHDELRDFAADPMPILNRDGKMQGSLVAASLLPKINSCARLEDLIQAIESLDEETRGIILQAFDSEGFELRSLFFGPWNGILTGLDDCSYEAFAEILKKAISAGRDWNHFPFMAMAARTLGALLDEVLGDREAAESVITVTIAEVGETPNLIEELASILFNHGEYEEALEIWRRVLPKWPPDPFCFDTQPGTSLRLAAIAAGNLKKWDESADWFEKAREHAEAHGKNWSLGMLIDQGYALWKAGNHEKALFRFEQGVEGLSELDSDDRDSGDFGVIKMIGGCLTNLVNPSKDNAAVPGMCSDITNYERVKELPPTPPEFIWASMYELAEEGRNRDLAQKFLNRCLKIKNSILHLNVLRIQMENLRPESINDLACLALKTGDALVKANARIDVPLHELDPEGLAVDPPGIEIFRQFSKFFQGAMVVSIGVKRNPLEVVKCWLDSVIEKSKVLSESLAEIEELCSLDNNDLVRILSDGKEDGERRRFAAVIILGRDISPEDAVYAQLVVLSTVSQSNIFWGKIGNYFNDIVRETWLKHLENRFLLRSPGINVPLIEAACKNSHKGWSASVDIVFAALPATNLKVDRSFLSAASSAKDVGSR